jgi:PAS domain S-box-containing protein
MTTEQTTSPAPEREAFIAAELRQVFQLSLFRATAFGSAMFLVFAVLDRVATPEHFALFLRYRLVAAGALLAVAVLSRRTRRLPVLLGMAYAATLVSAVLLELMVLHHGGHQSNYYAGLLVIGVCAVSFVPGPLAFHVPLSVSIWLVYVVPILLTERITDPATFFASNFFMVAILATVLTMRYFSHQSLTREFELRYDLHRQRRELEELVVRRTADLWQAVESMREEIASRERVQEELRQASDDWRVTFDSTEDLIVMTDAAGRIVKVNRATARFFGLPYAEILGKDCSTLFSAFLPVNGDTPFCAVRETHRHAEGEVTHPGRGLWLAVTADPVGAGQGEVKGAVYILRDITPHKKAEEEKKTLEDALVQMQKMDSIGRLAGGIAHDFNNILSAILGYGEVALFKVPEDHPAREPLRVVLDSAERAAALTQQLLAFSRKQVLAAKVLNLNTVVEEMARMLFRVIRENVRIELRTERRVGNILADKSQVEQVILNLVVNARDAMPQGGSLVVETADVDLAPERGPAYRGVKPGPYVMLAVTDTGEGMTAEVREKIFEPFFTTKEVGKGTGLGLATVYGIVKQHEGHIVVESTPGSGSTFRVYFPLTRDAVEKQFSANVAATLKGTERVLVVDDDLLLRTMIRDALKALGYEVLLAADATEALRFAENGGVPVDLLLADIVLPGMNGRELADAFRARRPDTKVVLMSGHMDDTVEQQRRQRAGVPFLLKPLAPSKFVRVLREVLDGKQPAEAAAPPADPPA